jgi:hypothetical protein
VVEVQLEGGNTRALLRNPRPIRSGDKIKIADKSWSGTIGHIGHAIGFPGDAGRLLRLRSRRAPSFPRSPPSSSPPRSAPGGLAQVRIARIEASWRQALSRRPPILPPARWYPFPDRFPDFLLL